MASHIPFIGSGADVDLSKRYFHDSEIFRVDLSFLAKHPLQWPSKLWVDAGVDGLQSLQGKTVQWRSYISEFEHYEDIADAAFQESPDKQKVEKFTFAVLDACRKFKPHWISVPQLPSAAQGAPPNRLNRLFADATGKWKTKHGFRGRLILPIVFTHQKQVNYKTERTRRLSAAANCLERASAQGVWVVDSTLSDFSGSPTLQKKRFPELVNFHEELKKALSDRMVIVAGPYWGMNLVLWARGLIDHPAVGVGSGYQYFLSGGTTRPPKVRIAIPPLRRRAIVSPQLRNWLSASLQRMAPDDVASEELRDLIRDFPRLQDLTATKRQTAEFYKSWFDLIAKSPGPGRALTLYQDLSSAYVLGKTLDDLPKSEETARKPARIAEQLMLFCL